MAIDPSIISALQGSQAPFGLGAPPMPAPSGLFGVPPQHLQQMAGDVIPFPGAYNLMKGSNQAGFDMPGRYVGQAPTGEARIFGADPRAMELFQKGDPEVYNNYMAWRSGVAPGSGGPKSWGMMHPSPGTLMRYFREQGLLPD